MLLKISWKESDKIHEQVCDVKMASKLMYELEMQKGIKATFCVQR